MSYRIEKRILLTTVNRLELQRNCGFSCWINAVEHGRNLVTPVDAGHEQKAQFVDETRLEECTVDVAAAFEQ